MNEALAALPAARCPFSFIVLDIDYFKKTIPTAMILATGPWPPDQGAQ